MCGDLSTCDAAPSHLQLASPGGQRRAAGGTEGVPRRQLLAPQSLLRHHGRDGQPSAVPPGRSPPQHPGDGPIPQVHQGSCPGGGACHRRTEGARHPLTKWTCPTPPGASGVDPSMAGITANQVHCFPSFSLQCKPMQQKFRPTEHRWCSQPVQVASDDSLKTRTVMQQMCQKLTLQWYGCQNFSLAPCYLSAAQYRVRHYLLYVWPTETIHNPSVFPHNISLMSPSYNSHHISFPLITTIIITISKHRMYDTTGIYITHTNPTIFRA